MHPKVVDMAKFAATRAFVECQTQIEDDVGIQEQVSELVCWSDV